MNKERDEKLLKSWLKRKITITTSTVVAFLITGMVGATVVYGAVNIENTNGNTISNGSANGPGVSIGGDAKTQSGSDISIGESAGKDSNSTGNSVAIGKNSRVGDQTVNQSIAIGGGNATGQGAWAKGDQSIAIGGNTRSEGHSSIAIGGDDLDNVAKQVIGYVNAKDEQASGSIQDAMKNLTGVDILNPQYSNTMSGHGAVAVGVKAVAGHLSLALGTAANAGATGYENAITYKAVNTVAIGSGASAMLDNAIAIGGGAKADESSRGKKQTGATIKSIEYKWKGGDKIAAGDIVSFGAKGFERQLKNIAPGEVSEESTDGINGSQLYGIAKNITSENHLKYLGDDAQNDETKIVNLSLEKNKLNIVGEADTTKLSDANIGVVYESGNNKAADGKDLDTDNPAYQEGKLKIKLSKELKNLKSAEFKTDTGDKTVINGNGVTIAPVTAGKQPVSLTKNGLDNGGNVIANVAGNLEGAKPNSTEPTTNATAPNNASTIKNNAATVGDVLQAGWNLQEKGVAKDFVKPYDTVNFIDGNGTSVAVETTNGTTSTVKYNVNLGNGLEKNGTNEITIKPADKSLEVNKDGVKVKTDGTTITTDPTNGLKVVTGGIEAGTTPGTVKVTDGDNDKIATVDSVVNAVNSAAFTLKASAIEGGTRNTGSTVTTKGESIKAGNTVEMIAGKNLEVTHNKNGKITFATVENPSFETVQIGNDGPKFSATNDGNIRVSDKDDTKPVKITNVKDGEISKTSKDAINGSQFHKLANNTIKLAGKNGGDAATETDAQNLNQQDGIKFTVKSSDGKLLEVTAGGDTITLTPKTGTITTTNGVPTANTTNGKLVTADQIVNALTEMGWKATADKDGTGTVTGTTPELIKAGETVTFKAGDNLAIKQDGKNFIYSLNTALSGLTSAEFKDDNKNKVNITPTGITITKPADTVNNQPEKTVTLNQNGLNNGGNLITNVASNLDGAKTGTIAPTTKATAPTNVGDIKNNAATVGDVLNAGWNLQGNGEEKDFVQPYDTVNFINGDGTTATVETTDNKVSTVKYSVNLGDGLKKDDTGNTISIKPADKSLEVNKDGLKVKTDDTTITTDDNKGLKVVTGAIESVTTGNDSGTVKVKEGDTGKIATVDSVVNAVNSAAFTLKASATTGGTRNGSSSVGENGEDIKAGKTIEMIAGKNLNVTHNENGKIIFATVDTPTFSTVQVGGDQGPKFSKTSDGDIKVSDKDGANPVKVTNVKDGAVTDTSTDAINGSQFHKVANNTIKLAGQNGDDATTATQTKEQNLNKQGGIKFTVKSSDGKLLEVTAGGDTITLTPKTGTITTTNGVPTANTTNGKLVTADQIVNALTEMGWKATADKDGTGTVTGTASELIKAGETVTFKAGDNLIIKQAGKDFTYSLAKELKDLSKVEVKDTSGNSVVTTPTGTTTTDGTNTTTVGPTGTITKDKDGNTTKVDGNGVTITPGKDDPANPGTKISDTDKAVSLTKDGLNNGGNKITNVTSGLDKITTGPAKDLVDLSKPTGGSTPKVSDNTAATVGDLRNMGWVVSSDKTTDNLGTAYSEAVKNANEVKFVGKGAATVSGKTVDGVRTVTVDVTVPDVEKGTIEPDTGDNKGKVKSKAGDGDKFTTVDTVVNAINSAAWKATSGVEGTGTTATSVHTKSDEEIKAGDTVTFKAGDNLIIKQAGKDFTYSLAKELKDLSKVEVKDTSGNSVVTTPTGTTTTDGTNTTTVGPTGTITKDKDGNTTKVDGNGVTITPGKDDPANPGTKISDTDKAVSLTKDGLNNGGNAITNVAGNLEGAKKDTTSPKTNAAAPTNVDAIKNNAATVGDVLNAGWNLRNNGTAKDFVKPYDTVNFVDGENTKVVVETDKDGKSSTIKVDVKDNLKNITSISNEGAKDENGNSIPENKATKIALGTDANGNKTVDVGEAKITNVADGDVTDTSKDAVNGSQLKAVKDEAEKHTTLSVNGGDKDKAGNKSPAGNLVIAETTNDKGGKHYDVKLADKVTLGTDDTKAVTVDGTTGKITAGKGENGVGIDGTKAEIKAGDGANAVTINGKEGKVTVGDNITLNNADKSATIGDVKVDGKDGHITGLKNKDWTIGTTQSVSGRAATEDQLKKLEDGIVDKIDNLGWEATVGKEGTGKSEPDAKNNKETVRVDHTTNVHYQAGDNLIVKEEIIRAKDAAGKDTDKVSDAKYTYRLNDEITLHNVTVKPKDGKDGAFTVQNADGKDAVSIKRDADGAGAISVNGKDGKPAVAIGKDGVAVKGEDGKPDAVSITKDADGNGTVAVKGADGKSGVSLNGKDGSIGINGKDGSSVSMTTEKGPKGLDEENEKPRMTYEFTKTNPDGTPVLDPTTNKPVTVKENLATMNDGLHFAGDNNDKTISKKLNEKLEIVGGADRDKLTKNNIGVNANAEGKLEVQLSKELKGMTSAEFTDPNTGNIVKITGEGTTITNPKTGDTVIMNQGGITISKTDKDGKPNNVSLTREGLNNGGNNITNVKSNLPQVNDSAKKAYDVNGNPIANKNNTAAPITAVEAADIVKKAGNNAATVGDVLNAGWNLQENGSDRDFVKPYDTVNFVDGTNTKVTVKTNEDGTKSNVQINLVGLPIAFADKDGNRVVQGVKDGKIVYHKMLSDGTASKELVDPKNVQVTNVNPTDAKINTVGTPGATINNVAPAEISPTSTQAVNGSQLYQVAQEINNVNNKVDKLGERVNKGLAGAAAMSGIEFMEIGINQATVAAAVGGYRGTHAVAVGVQAAPTENTRVNAKMSLTPGSRTEAMYSVGAAYRFNLK